MDLESNYFLYGGNPQEEATGERAPLLQEEGPVDVVEDTTGKGPGRFSAIINSRLNRSTRLNKNFKLFVVVVVVLFSIIFLVFGILNIIPHTTKFEGGEKCEDLYEEIEKTNEETGEKEIEKKPTGEKKCVNLDDSYLFEHEKGGDRLMRELKIGLNFTCFSLMIILAIGIYISFDGSLNLKEFSFITEKTHKRIFYGFGIFIVIMMLLSILVNTGNFFGLEKVANEKADKKMKEELCKEDGISRSYNLCLRSIGRGETDTREKILDDKNANMVIKKDYDLCTLGFRNKIENDMRPIKNKYDIIRKIETDAIKNNETFVYPQEHSNFKDTFNKYRELGDKVETELTETKTITNSQTGITAETQVETGVFVLDLKKLVARALENNKDSPREQCIIESTLAFQRTQEHKDCTKASQEQTDEDFKTWKTCSEKEEYKKKQQEKQQKAAKKALDEEFARNNSSKDPLKDGNPDDNEKAEAALGAAESTE